MIGKLVTACAAALLLATPALADTPHAQFFGAIALGTPASPSAKPYSIWIDDSHGQASANANAMRMCNDAHRTGCQVVAFGANTCMATAWSGNYTGAGWTWVDADKQVSINQAVRACRAGAHSATCNFAWACTYGDPAKSSKAAD